MTVRRSLSLFASVMLWSSAVSMLGQDAPALAPEPVAIQMRAAKLDEYVGQYREASEPEVVSSVYREGDALYVEGERSPKMELKA